MELPRGCCLLLLASFLFVLITLLAFNYSLRDPEWCNASLNAGDCQMYDEDKTCYCVDTTNTGQDQIDGEWYWIKEEAEVRAEEILWRPDVPPKTNDSHAIVTVESIEQGDEYNYVLYNYDHYIDNDKSYQWYGITTTDNKPNHMRGTYYICHYTEEPENSTQSSIETSTSYERKSGDGCECENNRKVFLSEEEPSQTFSSPRYPNNYCSDLNCRWTIITTDRDLVIMVQLIVLSLEINMDYLYIHDGENDDSPLIQSCTGITCDDRKSSGPAVHIHFNSDHVITNIGFKFRVTATPKDACYCSELVSISLTNVGESIVVSSPNYPNSCCPNMNCKWLITAPTDLGIELHWERFETEENADFVHLYDGNQMENSEIDHCSGLTCPSFMSATTQVYVQFVSNNRNTTDIGFKFIARVVKNYCMLEALFLGIIPQLGTVTSTKAPRTDGNIPHGVVLTLVCPPHHKILNTVDQITNSATCLSPLWSDLLGTCIPACHLNFSSEYTPKDVHFCGFGDNLVTQLVEKGDEVTVSRYDHVHGHRLIEKKKYTCIDANLWNEQPPICHPMAIAIFGGTQVGAAQSIELYTPTDKIQTSELLDLELLWPHTAQNSAAELPSGDVLVISSSLVSDNSQGMVERVNINSNQVTAAPQVSIAIGGRAAVIDGIIYVCGGTKDIDAANNFPLFRKACEVFQNGKWVAGVPMLRARNGFGMVAVGQSLYAIGGEDDKRVREKHRFTAEKYSVEDQSWSFIAPMINPHFIHCTAVLEGSIYVCGTKATHHEYLDRSCDIYSPETDQWQILAAKMFAHPHSHSCLVAFGGKLFAFGLEMRTDLTNKKVDHTVVEMYDLGTGKWTIVGNTKIERTEGAAVMVAYERNIPIKENQTQVINSKLNHVLNISALGHTKVTSDKGITLPVFIGKSDKAPDGECTCGTSMTIELMSLEDSKTIESPGYPTGYCNYHRCLWNISTAESLEHNLAVSLKWAAFSTENLMDMVYIYDQTGLLEVCTGSHCSNHKSSGNTLFVYFESDHVTSDIGFKMGVTAIDADPCYCSELNEVLLNSPDESFTLESPNYPQSYCANHQCAWHVSVPEDHIIRINWKTFELGKGHTFKIQAASQGQIDTLISNCTNRDCEDLQTPKNELYMNFSSNIDISSSSNVFSALITTGHSYCKKLHVPVGSISYDRESRLDGNLAIGTVATLVCPKDYKISDSVHDMKSNITCVAPDWSDKLKTCTQVCKIDTTFKSFDNTNICTFDDDVHTDLEPVGHKVFVKEYDFMADEMKHDTDQIFSCTQSGWSPETPVCHKLAILMYGNIEHAAEHDYNKDNKTILFLYYPQEKTSDVLETALEVERAEYMTTMTDYPLFQASPLNNGCVLLSGENIGSVQLDLFSGTITQMPNPIVNRRHAASAQLGGRVYVCGGSQGYFEHSTVLKSCEVWHSDIWSPLDAVMNTERKLLAMVATDDAIYAIGGIGSNYNALASVEKYMPQHGSWQSVAPLEESLYSAAAVYYQGFILLCGGVPAEITSFVQSDKCYKYIDSEDEWQDMPSMHFERQLFSMVVFAGRVYVTGGLYSLYPIDDVPVLAVESYDNRKEEWSIETEFPDNIIYAISPSSVIVVNWENSIFKHI